MKPKAAYNLKSIFCYCALKTSEISLSKMVQRAGFEPANPYGKGYPIGRSSQSVDLESLVERTVPCALSPLTWLGYRCTQTTNFQILSY